MGVLDDGQTEYFSRNMFKDFAQVHVVFKITWVYTPAFLFNEGADLKCVILEGHRSGKNARAIQVLKNLRSNKKIYVKNIFMTTIHSNKRKISFTNRAFFFFFSKIVFNIWSYKKYL